MMDENRRAALADELGDAVRERERLNHVITYLSDRLGIPEPPNDRFGIPVVGAGQPAPPPQAKPPAPSTSPPPRPTPPSAQRQPLVERTPAELVREGEFSSLSKTEAAAAVLGRVGSPLTTAELHSAVAKGGVNVKDRGTLYRSMYRVDRFTRVGTALWGLTEWHPQNGQRAQNTDPVEEVTPPDKDAMVPGHGERLDEVDA